MASKRPAKLAIGKKAEQKVPNDPVTGKPMTAVKVVRRDGAAGMHWVVLEDFKGKDEDVARMIPVR